MEFMRIVYGSGERGAMQTCRVRTCPTAMRRKDYDPFMEVAKVHAELREAIRETAAVPLPK
ncbi:MAG: hypothetical protein ABMA01_12165 [Chthoniobacteraceae bacterium]